jgi:hypothetical protein
MRFEQDFLNWLRTQRKEQALRFGLYGRSCAGCRWVARWPARDHSLELVRRDYPLVTVDRDPIYVRDGNCYTSAGVTAGIDLALALVEEDLGRPLALKVAAGHHHMSAAASPLAALLATAVHTAAYLAVTGIIAWVVYSKFGLAILRKAWLNLNLVWAAALVVTSVVTLLV